MIFTLSATSVAEIARALAAYRALTLTPGQAAVLSPVLDPGRKPIFATIVSHAFAGIVLELMPWTDNYSEADPDYPSLDLRIPAGTPPDTIIAIGRHIEEAVALSALARLCSAAAGGESLADTFSACARASLSSLKLALTPRFNVFYR